MISIVGSIFSISLAVHLSKHHFFQTDNLKAVLSTVFSLLDPFLNRCIVVAVAKENLPKTLIIVSLVNFRHI